MNEHVWNQLPDRFKIASATENYDIKKSACSVSRTPKSHARDLVAVELPRHVRCHRSIIQHVLTLQDFDIVREPGAVSLVGYNRERILHVRSTNNVRPLTSEIYVATNGATVVLREGYEYALDTEKGDCGSILLFNDKRCVHKIAGIHGAGGKLTTYTGVAVSFHRELLDIMLESLTREAKLDGTIVPPREIDIYLGPNNEVCAMRGLQAGFGTIGQLDKPVHSATNTKYRPSPIQEKCPLQVPLTRPTPLAPFRGLNGEIVNPYALSLKKAAGDPIFIEPELIEIAANDFRQSVLLGSTPEDREVQTWNSTIKGKEGDDCYPPLKRDTSMGYGWPSRADGKHAYFGRDDDWNLEHPEVLARYAAVEQRLANGQRTGSVYTLTLKDETRPIEKVLLGKTRLFAANEAINVLLQRRYYGGFCAHVMRNRVLNEVCVGVNAFGSDWSRLALHLKSKGKKVIAGDFTNYDGCLPAQILWAVHDLIREHYFEATPEEQAKRELMWLDVVNSVHVHGRDMFMWTHSQPSGCAFTSILNSCINSIAVRMAYIVLARELSPENATMEAFHSFIAFASYGDDNVINVSDTITDWFTPANLTRAYASFGFTYTDVDKSGETQFRALEDVTFLKRGFWYNDGRYRAPLQLDVILEIPNWIKGGNTWELTSLCLRAAAKELANHPREVWDRHSADLAKAAGLVATRVPGYTLESFETYQREFQRICYGRPTLLTEPTFPQPIHMLSPIYCAQSDEGAMPMATESLEMQDQDGGAGTSTALEAVDALELTTMFEDGTVLKSDRALDAPAGNMYTAVASDALTNDIIGFLSRPQFMVTATWPSATGFLGPLIAVRLPALWLNKPQIVKKLSGFAYARFDLVVRIQVNAQRFNTGALIMWFEPLAQQLTHPPSSTKYLGGLTGYPHVFYWVEDGTAAELTIPYNNVYAFFDLVRGHGTMGEVRVQVASPLTGGADADVSMWIRATNIVLGPPTGVTPTYTAQSNVTAEKRATKQGTLSAVAGAAGGVLRKVGQIPFIGSFANQAADIASVVGGAASLFGFSKPADDKFPRSVQVVNVPNMATGDGVSKPKVPALESGITTDIATSVFGTEEDEMSIKSLLDRPIFMDVFKFSRLDAHSSVIWKWPVSPSSCNKIAVTDPAGGYISTSTMMSYLSCCAAFWRGSIVYEFRIVKTQFHSGRLRFCWVPGAIPTTNTATIDFDNSYSEVHDIREQSVIRFTVPYVWFAEWSDLRVKSTDGSLVCRDRPTGMLYITVLNALRAPDAVASSVEILVFTSAGEDFQLAFPGWNEFNARPTTTYNGLPEPTTSRYEMQSNLMPTGTVQKGFTPNATAYGERWVSLRQLGKRYSPWVGVPDNNVRPNFANLRDRTLPELMAEPIDFLTIFEPLYRFKCGSVRLLVVRLLESMGQPNSVSTTPFIRSGYVGPSGFIPVIEWFPFIEPFVEILAPFYQRVPAVPTDLGAPAQKDDESNENADPFTETYSNRGTVLTFSKPLGDQARVYRAIGEDFAFGFRVGPPPVLWVPAP